ncbi:YihY/virulence factor BrkB family protein [Nitratireductor aquimarinus]|uniref:YihY/virulence factor BrkB family protein n=1 Tax=Alphaproteobacteria TaxID=28211 RepID=UPI0013AF4D0B|nr:MULTISPECIES: YihY/virulence factor BrkB family protein [Alphaproteobacteria]MBN7762190.1 YihY/virulence factor BrkB family protein [Nitratireductor aquibiodomus]MBN7778087.1 YihY/virulence factor BrkB family protein [Nitratireductor pacificus]MBY6022516.1 YihY/virulence factor BrkB family protein [Nitratireductor sp. DP7N14-4]MBN7757725.1 YihY/virulence factor BrkB family protein [Nitratireductor aquimarinus]MBN7782409.1 YihY/virulence factor BrkB family protein [Nitratireductor pacificus]
MRGLNATRRILGDALGHFNTDDGWAMASHVAISALMALFPFLIFATALASFLGADAFSQQAVDLIFDTWPKEVAEPIAQEVHNVLGVRRSDVLTFGVVLAGVFASNGVEALRLSLNRAYRVSEQRSIFRLRAQSLIFVLVATIGFLAISLLLVIAPVALNIAESNFEWIAPYVGTITFWRYVIALTVLILALITVHLWLPAGRRSLLDVLPGIAFTLLGSFVGSSVFAAYLGRFSSYASTYAGLASIMIAVVFLYIISAMFILGGELNASIKRYREARIVAGAD